MILPELFEYIDNYLNSAILLHLNNRISEIINTKIISYDIYSNNIYNIGFSMTRRLYTDINKLSFFAAKNGYKHILTYSIHHGAKYINIIAGHAAIGGYIDILLAMIKLGADNWSHIANCASYSGQEEILLFMIYKGANNWNTMSKFATMQRQSKICILLDKYRNI